LQGEKYRFSEIRRPWEEALKEEPENESGQIK
jgi:hypothetical protein